MGDPQRTVYCQLGNYRGVGCDWCRINVNVAGHFCLQSVIFKALKNHPYQSNVSLNWGDRIRPWTKEELTDDNVATGTGVGTGVDGCQTKVKAEAEKQMGLDSDPCESTDKFYDKPTEERVGECIGE